MARGGRAAAAAAQAPDREARTDECAPEHAVGARTVQILGWIGEYLSAQNSPMLKLLLAQFSQIDLAVVGQNESQCLMEVAIRSSPTMAKYAQLQSLANYMDKEAHLGDWDPIVDAADERKPCSNKMCTAEQEFFKLSVDLRTQSVLRLCDSEDYSIDPLKWEQAVEQNFVLKPENDPDGALSRALRSRKTLLQKMKQNNQLLKQFVVNNTIEDTAERLTKYLEPIRQTLPSTHLDNFYDQYRTGIEMGPAATSNNDKAVQPTAAPVDAKAAGTSQTELDKPAAVCTHAATEDKTEPSAEQSIIDTAAAISSLTTGLDDALPLELTQGCFTLREIKDGSGQDDEKFIDIWELVHPGVARWIENAARHRTAKTAEAEDVHNVTASGPETRQSRKSRSRDAAAKVANELAQQSAALREKGGQDPLKDSLQAAATASRARTVPKNSSVGPTAPVEPDPASVPLQPVLGRLNKYVVSPKYNKKSMTARQVGWDEPDSQDDIIETDSARRGSVGNGNGTLPVRRAFVPPGVNRISNGGDPYDATELPPAQLSSPSVARFAANISSSAGPTSSAKRKRGPILEQQRAGKQRRAYNRWTPEEDRDLKAGVGAMGTKWSKILRTYHFNDRTAVDLKDRWRNILKREQKE